LTDPQGRVIGALSTARDITERQQEEDRLNAQMDELRRWHEATLGRETRILELKAEVNELLVLFGREPRYPSADAKAPGRTR
jgi:hypothetical protein